MKQKVFASASDAISKAVELGHLHDDSTLHVGGFGLCGIPEQLIIALRDSGKSGLTCISNNAGVDDWGLGLLLQTKQIKKMVSSYVGENDEFARQFLEGELEIDFKGESREYVAETGLFADVALVKAWKADEAGNLVFRKTARNFNPMMATAASFTIAEVEEIVPLGSLDADFVHTPGAFVDAIVKTDSEKRIEQRTVSS
jgi:3-oxoacid CoA-transferase subunit A